MNMHHCSFDGIVIIKICHILKTNGITDIYIVASSVFHCTSFLICDQMVFSFIVMMFSADPGITNESHDPGSGFK